MLLHLLASGIVLAIHGCELILQCQFNTLHLTPRSGVCLACSGKVQFCRIGFDPRLQHVDLSDLPRLIQPVGNRDRSFADANQLIGVCLMSAARPRR